MQEAGRRFMPDMKRVEAKFRAAVKKREIALQANNQRLLTEANMEFTDALKPIEEYLTNLIANRLGANRNSTEVQIILNDTRLRVFKSAGTFRGDAQLSTWLFPIVQGSVSAYIKQETKARNPSVALQQSLSGTEESLVNVMQREGNPDEEVSDFDQTLFGIITLCFAGEKKEKYRFALIFEAFELKQDDIAKIMERTPTGVRTLIGRGKQLLRQCDTFRKWAKERRIS